jgi:hypothetical protein
VAKGVKGCVVRCTCLACGCCVYSKFRVAKCGCSFTKAPDLSCKHKEDLEKDRGTEHLLSSPPDQTRKVAALPGLSFLFQGTAVEVCNVHAKALPWKYVTCMPEA